MSERKRQKNDTGANVISALALDFLQERPIGLSPTPTQGAFLAPATIQMCVGCFTVCKEKAKHISVTKNSTKCCPKYQAAVRIINAYERKYGGGINEDKIPDAVLVSMMLSKPADSSVDSLLVLAQGDDWDPTTKFTEPASCGGQSIHVQRAMGHLFNELLEAYKKHFIGGG